ncbi:MAG TPA: serine/threonine-protein kinase [Gemmataceae bacterium]|nr:serine/threonine-protein kinase [Gemmataceae bacterium]
MAITLQPAAHSTPQNGFASLSSSPARRQVALVPGSCPHIESEFTPLLRRRLLVASGIALFVFGLFLISNFISPSALPSFVLVQTMHATVVAILVLSTALLASPLPIPFCRLRKLELLTFGLMAVFFLVSEYEFVITGEVMRLAAAGREPELIRLGALTFTQRWFCIIVVYGTFIPNTWKRAAAVTGTMAGVLLLCTLSQALFNPLVGKYLWIPFTDELILLTIGVMVAVFGSYKILQLHERAFEAQKLGQYSLKEKLGAGGMGEVYLGEHILLRRPCAIKVIRPDRSGDPKTLLRFEREVRVMATLTHWNTVEIFDYGHTEDGTFYYVMEYLPGLSLQELVDQSGPLAPERAVSLLRQVAGALREAHAIGFIHRDIKPSNIIACERGRVYDVAKLLDFGLVKGFGQSQELIGATQDGAITGSPAYMSPEQGVGKPLDARSDIYSLGAVAYFLLTGQMPFVRDNPMQVILAHAHDEVVPPATLRPGIPDDLERLILRCLEKEPGNRFQSVDELETILADCRLEQSWTQNRARLWWEDYATQKSEMPPRSNPNLRETVQLAQT